MTRRALGVKTLGGPCLRLGAGLGIGVLMALAAACFAPPPTPADGRTPVWIDTDVAIGEATGDVADGFALLQAFHSATIVVRGVSVVHGELPLVRTWPIAQDIVTRFGPEGLRAWRGAAGPHELGAPTEASEALATSLRAEPLTIVALGPLTNVASTLRGNAGLAARVVRVVVAWRSAHVASDPEAMRAVLDSGVPLTIVPFTAADGLSLSEEALGDLDAGPAGARFLAESARARRRAVTDSAADDPVQLFETVAVDVVASPGRVACGEAHAALVGSSSPALEVAAGTGARAVTSCPQADAGLMSRVIATLASPSR